jgi:hypothetical protein
MDTLTTSEPGVDDDEDIVVSLPEAALSDIAGLEASWREPEAAAEPEQAPSQEERRRSQRRTPEDFKGDLRLAIAGFSMRLVNLSSTGLLAETDQRLCPGHTVDVFLRYGGRRTVLKATVVRSLMHAVSPSPIFRTALQFQETLTLQGASL